MPARLRSWTASLNRTCIETHPAPYPRERLHREHLSEIGLQRQAGIANRAELLARPVTGNNALTSTVRVLTGQIEGMTAHIHRIVLPVPATEILWNIWSGATTS